MKLGKYRIEHTDDSWYRCWGVFVITLFAEKKAPYTLYKTFRLCPRFISIPFYNFIEWKKKYLLHRTPFSTRLFFLKSHNYFKKHYNDLTLKWYLTGIK